MKHYMRILTLALLLFIPFIAVAQDESDTTPGKLPVFTYVEQMPESDYDLSQYLSENIKYPQEAIDQNIEGRVYVKFVVNTKGNITGVTTVKKLHPLLDAEAIRVVSKMPKWKPGKQNGKYVSVYYTLPINFKLTKSVNQ